MMHDAERSWRWVVNVEHVFNPVGTVRYTHVHPICAIVSHAAVADRLKTEDIFIEFVRSVAIVNGDSDVNHSFGYACGGQELAKVSAVKRAGHVLDKFNHVPVGILHHVTEISIQAGMESFRHSY